MARPVTVLFVVLAAAAASACRHDPLEVSNIQLGRSLNSDNSVASPTTLFKPHETVYVSVLTSNTGASTLAVTWSYQGRVIDRPSKHASFTGGGATEFHLQNGRGFPPGDYSVEVFVDGRSVARRAFKVDDRLK